MDDQPTDREFQQAVGDPATHLALGVNILDENCDGIEFGLLTLDQKLFERLIALTKRAEKLSQEPGMGGFYAFNLFEDTPDWSNQDEGEIYDRFSEDDLEWDYVTQAEADQLNLKPARAECVQLVVKPDGVYWEGVIKHADVRFETQCLGREVLEEVLAEIIGPLPGTFELAVYTGPRYQAHFQPQAWSVIGGKEYIDSVPDEGPDTWDCTREVLANPAIKAEIDKVGDWPDHNDHFKSDPDAPEWVRTWEGPFDISVEVLDHDD